MTDLNSTVVSVVIPTYNRRGALIRALDSVAAQTHNRIETIVIDDCSDDPVEAWLDSSKHSLYDLKIVRHDENRGAPAARTTGIKKATGEYIAFLDDDDAWKPKKIERQLEVFSEYKNCGMVYVGREFISDGSIVTRAVTEKSGYLHRELLCKNFIGSYSTVMVHRAAVDSAGMPDERFPTEQDWEWYIRIARDWQIIAIAESLTKRYGSGISSKYESKRKISYPLLLEKYEDDAAEYGWLFVRYWKSRILFDAGWEALIRTEERRISRRYFVKSLVYNPLNYSSWAFLIASFGIILFEHLPPSFKRRLGQIVRP